MTRPILLLVLALPFFSIEAPWWPSSRPEASVPAPDKLEEAIKAFHKAIADGDEEARTIAMGVLLDMKHADVAAVFEGEYAVSSEALRNARDRVLETSIEVDQKEELLARLELRSKNENLADEIRDLRKELKDLRDKLLRNERRIKDKQRWCEELGIATQELFAKLAGGARRKAEKAVWADAKEHPDLAVRIGAIEILGQVGTDDTAADLIGWMSKTESERVKVKKTLPKLEAEVRALEARLQEEANEGRENGPSYKQYQSKSREAAAVYKTLVLLSHVVDASAEAAGRCISRLTPEEQEKLVASVVRQQSRAKKGLKLRYLDILRHAEGPAVAGTLRSMLATEEDPLLRAELIDSLAARKDERLADAVIEAHLGDDNWHVQSRSAAALATLRAKAGIPALIAHLQVAEGRVRSDVSAALSSLTGQRFAGRADLWQAWWEDNGDTFEVPEEEQQPEGTLTVQERVGLTFFGIRTESQRVMFILDLSGSMQFGMDQRSESRNPRPRDGQETRLQVAKRELSKAIGGVKEGGEFNLIMYGNDVWSWDDEMVQMDGEARAEIATFIQGLGAVGGTNIFRALQYAFDLAGVEDSGEWNEPAFDTLYLLSDGRPSVGAVQSSSGILSFVQEKNRSAGITIHTIGLSSEQDAFLLRSLAEQNGGQYAAR